MLALLDPVIRKERRIITFKKKKKEKKKQFSKNELTKSIANGANIDPNRPIIEHKFMSVFRILVGHTSAEKTYKTANADDVAHIPMKKVIRMISVKCDGTNVERIVAVPATINALHIAVRRPTYFNKKYVIIAAGASAIIVVI